MRLAKATGMKTCKCVQVLTSLAEVVHKETKKNGKISMITAYPTKGLPGLGLIKTRGDPSTKGGKRSMFGIFVMW